MPGLEQLPRSTAASFSMGDRVPACCENQLRVGRRRSEGCDWALVRFEGARQLPSSCKQHTLRMRPPCRAEAATAAASVPKQKRSAPA